VLLCCPHRSGVLPEPQVRFGGVDAASATPLLHSPVAVQAAPSMQPYRRERVWQLTALLRVRYSMLSEK